MRLARLFLSAAVLIAALVAAWPAAAAPSRQDHQLSSPRRVTAHSSQA